MLGSGLVDQSGIALVFQSEALAIDVDDNGVAVKCHWLNQYQSRLVGDSRKRRDLTSGIGGWPKSACTRDSTDSGFL